MKTTEKQSLSKDESADENPSVFDERLDVVLSMLPEGARPYAEKGVNWIKDHPVEAVLIGTAGGFTVGVLGIARTMVAGRLLRSYPAVIPGLIAGVATVVQAFEARKSDERITH